DTAVLRLRIGTPVLPIDVGLNSDVRMLGIFMEEISVDPVRRDAASAALVLTKDGGDLEALWEGWCEPEAPGCWTCGTRSGLRGRAVAAAPAGAGLTVGLSWGAPGRDGVRGRSRVNGRAGGDFHVPPAQRLDDIVLLPLPDGPSAGEVVELAIEIENPRAPAD